MDSAVFACSKPSKMLQQVGALIIVLLHFCHTEDSCEANNDSLCHNTASADNPHLTEVTDWLKSLHEFKSEPFAQPLVAEAKPIIEIVSCDEGAWNYKYTGSKGKRKLFKGKGKLFFTKKEGSTHGYDYGMKTGHCLKRDLDIKSIEGDFDAKGILQGPIKVDYFDGTRIWGQVVDGVLHGLSKKFVEEIDEETNVVKKEKRLSAVQMLHSNQPIGNKWQFLLEGMVVYQETDEKEAVLFVPSNAENETTTYEVYKGMLDNQNMLLKAKKVQITYLKTENGFMDLKVMKEGGQTFDYDMETKSETNAAIAKMVRFFEYVTIETNPLEHKFSASQEPIKPNAWQILSFIEAHGEYYEANCPYDPTEKVIFKYTGQYNTDGKFHGNATLNMVSNYTYESLSNLGLVNETLLANLTESVKKEYLSLNAVSGLISWQSIQSLKGFFNDGKLQGLVEISFYDGVKLEAFASNNTLHGIARTIEPTRKLKFRSRYIAQAKIKQGGISYGVDPTIREVSRVGILKNGKPNGPSWTFLLGGSFHFGILTEDTKFITNFTTDYGAYIAQSMTVGYLGQFHEGHMKSGQIVDITGIEAIDNVVVPKFSEPSPSDQKYTHCPGQDKDVFHEALVPDPEEEKYVYVNESLVHGQGLFAKEDIPANTIFAYFGGFTYTSQAWNQTTFFDPLYVVKFVDGSQEYFMHLPDEFGISVDNYKATLGHKINMDFLDYNCVFVASHHPRFGLIAAAKSVTEIKAGQEILGHYKLKFHEGPPYYQEIWRTEVEHDTPEGPFGHREHKKPEGLPMPALLTDSALYKKFFHYATTELKLQPFT